MEKKNIVAGLALAAVMVIFTGINAGSEGTLQGALAGADATVQEAGADKDTSETGASAGDTASTAETGTETPQFQDEEAYVDHLVPSEYVEIGEYKGIEITVTKTEVTEEEIDEQISYFQEAVPAMPVKDRDVSQEGDIVNVDYSGRIKADDTVFEGGTATGASVTIGGTGYIEGFAEGMAGHKIGETFEEEVTFPAEYPNNPDLAGVEAIFTVTINSISETPKLTDDNIAELATSAFGLEGIESMQDLRDFIKEQLNAYNEEANNYAVMNMLDEKLVEGCKFADKLPERVVARYEYLTRRQFAYQAYQYQMSGYLNATPEQQIEMAMMTEGFTGNADEFIREKAEQQVKMLLAFYVIAEKENLLPTDAEVAEQVAATVASNGITSEDEFNTASGIRVKEMTEESMVGDAVEAFLKENAKITYEAGG